MLIIPELHKSQWPELVGMAATPAVTQIKQDRPDVAVEVIPPGWNQLRRQEPLRRLAASRYDYL